jgi:outer membrane protein assembly factor BamB
MGGFVMRHLFIVFAGCCMVAACGTDSWFGDTAPPPLPGKRVSVLSHEDALKPEGEDRTAIVLPEPERVADWPQAGGFAPHAMYHLFLGDKLKRAWSADLGVGGGKRRAFLTQPIVAERTVFAMDAEGMVSAYDLKDGDRKWRLDPTPDEDVGDGTYGGGLAYDGGKLFVTTGFAELLAVDPAKGKVLWRRALPAPVRGAPTVRAGRVLVITVENETIALAADDGRELWHHNGIAETASLMGGNSPAIDGNTVLAPYSSGELFALRIENGTVQWADAITSVKRTDQVETMTDIRGLTVIDRGRVYAADNSNILAAIDLRTGRRIWDKDLGSIQTPWVAGDYLYAISNTQELVCLDARQGQVRWVTPLQQWKDEEDKTGRIVWTGPVLASDRLIIASSAGEALAVSPYTGKMLGRQDLPDGVTIPPIVADDTLVFVTTDAELVAYR